MPKPMLKQPQNKTQMNNILNAESSSPLQVRRALSGDVGNAYFSRGLKAPTERCTANQNQQKKRQIQEIDKMKLDRLLRKTRSMEYIHALHKLDAGGHVQNRDKVNEIIDTIRSEFDDLDISSIMLGIVSVCNLGKPYEVHTLDITGQIIEHYKIGQILPGGLEKARSIALRGGYDFIEVYIDCCRAISTNGTVSVISY